MSVDSTGQIRMVGDMAVMDGRVYDLDTLLFALNAERVGILEGNMLDQCNQIKAHQDTLKEANKLMAEARSNQSQARSLDNTITWSVDHDTNTIYLDDGYKLTFDNTNMSWHICDKEGDQVRIWGDPHVQEGDAGKWDFKEQSTFVLEDGTKISVDTKPWSGNQNYFVTDSITITKGNQAVQVTGIGDNAVQISDVTLTGEGLDAQTNDGWIFVEKGGVDDWMDARGQEISSDQACTEKQNEVTIEANDIAMSDEMKRFCQEQGIQYTDSDGDGKLNAEEWSNLIESMTGLMDSLNSQSQMDMVRLQSLTNKYDESFDIMTNFISKQAKSRDNIVGNLR